MTGATLTERIRIQAPYVCDYVLREGPSKQRDRLYLLLHGYEESAERIYRALEPALLGVGSAAENSEAIILAVNGPYPLPRLKKNGTGYRVGFSWYFYDNLSDEYFIDPSVGVEYLDSLIEALDLKGVPTTAIGFSQGGYLAPFVAEKLTQIDRIIGIGSAFLHDEFKARRDCRFDSIHGAKDEVVDAANTRRLHEELERAGFQGEYRLLLETGHVIDDAVRAAVSELVR